MFVVMRLACLSLLVGLYDWLLLLRTNEQSKYKKRTAVDQLSILIALQLYSSLGDPSLQKGKFNQLVYLMNTDFAVENCLPNYSRHMHNVPLHQNRFIAYCSFNNPISSGIKLPNPDNSFLQYMRYPCIQRFGFVVDNCLSRNVRLPV